MTGFKVGDRVAYEDETGVITHFKNHKIWIHWDKTEDDAWVTEDMIRPITDTPSENFEGDEALKTHVLGDSVSFHGEPEETTFALSVHRVTGKIADLLIAKNKAYGDSALNPVRIFSKASRIEQLNVRIDDKISRIQRGTDFGDEDTVRDLIGYLVLRLIAEESE